jgi:hypothetical protein
MSKLIYFKRYLYVIDRLRSRPSTFNELQDYVLRKLEKDDIDTTFDIECIKYTITFQEKPQNHQNQFWWFFYSPNWELRCI